MTTTETDAYSETANEKVAGKRIYCVPCPHCHTAEALRFHRETSIHDPENRLWIYCAGHNHKCLNEGPIVADAHAREEYINDEHWRAATANAELLAVLGWNDEILRHLPKIYQSRITDTKDLRVAYKEAPTQGPNPE